MCKFTIVNTYEVQTPIANTIGINYIDLFLKASEQSLEEVLEKFKKLIHHPNSSFETISIFGDLSSSLNQLEEKSVFDYLVMGTKGASGIKEVFMGSNTVSVIKNVNCPVICIPENVTYKVPKKIAFAADYKKISHQDL